MAIDPNIALGIKPVEAPDVTGTLMNAMRLKSAMNEQALYPLKKQEMEQANTSRGLQNQREQTSIDAQKTLSGLISQNAHTDGASGPFAVNVPAVVQGMAKSGYADYGLKWEADQRANQKAAIDGIKSNLDVSDKKLKAVSNLLMPVYQEKDDEKAAELYQNARPLAIQNGLGTEDTIPAQFDRNWVATHALGAIDADKQMSEARQLADSHQKILENSAKTTKDWAGIFAGAQSQQGLDSLVVHAKAEGVPPEVMNLVPRVWSPEAMHALTSIAQTPEERVKAPGEAAKSNQDVMAGDAATLANAARSGRDAYDAALNALPHGRAQAFPPTPPAAGYDPDKLASQVTSRGLTPEQSTQAATAAAGHAETSRYHQLSLALRQNLGERGLSTAAVSREADKHDNLMKQAQDLRDSAEQLQGVIGTANGETVTLKNGTQQQMNVGLRTQAAQQYMANKNKAEALEKQAQGIRNRYGLDENGMQVAKPSVGPPSKVAPSAPPASTTPQKATAPPPAAAKVFPRSRLAAFAQANGMGTAAAEAQLKSQGYKVQ